MAKRELQRLTAKAVEKQKTAGRYADGGGLYLQVGPTGTKSWLFRYFITEKRTAAGKPKVTEMGLGPVHTITLVEARGKAQDCRRALLEGFDPLEARDAKRASVRLADAKSRPFKECAVDYIKVHRKGWKNAKHAAQWENTLDTYCYSKLGTLPVSKIDSGLVLSVLEPIWHTKPETAVRLRGRIESILDWATVRGHREGLNPARWRGHLDQTLPARTKVAKVEHHAALPFDATPAFVKDLRQEEGIAARALEFIILTTTRTAETLGATWAEVDEGARTFTIPAERMKAGREHRVPLSAAALEILRAMKPLANGADSPIFPSAKNGGELSNMACLAVLKRMKRVDITVHGFRSTFRDWASERTSFPSEVIEMALAHAIPDKVEAAYRRGDLFEKRRKLMDAWAQFCDKPTEEKPATIHHIEVRRNAKK